MGQTSPQNTDKRKPNQSALEHTECRHMALALEGLAGAVHAGHHVNADHLDRAAQASLRVWEAGPEPGPARDAEFRTLQSTLNGASAGCVRGLPKECAAVQQAAYRMALELRWMVRDLASHRPRRPAPQVEDVVADLQSHYGRYGQRLELMHH
jgi:hypothetical protein